MKQKFIAFIKEKQGKLILLGTGLTFLVVALQNLSYLKTSIASAFHKESDDLVIVDEYIKEDSCADETNVDSLKSNQAPEKTKAITSHKEKRTSNRAISPFNNGIKRPETSDNDLLAKIDTSRFNYIKRDSIDILLRYPEKPGVPSRSEMTRRALKPDTISGLKGLNIVGNTLIFRMLNVGEKTIALREAQFIVDSIWQVEQSVLIHTSGIDELSATYGVNLYDSGHSYITGLRLEQSISPNESDLFAFKLAGGIAVKNHWIKNEPYFILFKVKFYLNNTSNSIETKYMLHYFGGDHDIFAIDGKLQAADTASYPSDLKQLVTDLYRKEHDNYLSNFETAKRLKSWNIYKSPQAVNVLGKL